MGTCIDKPCLATTKQICDALGEKCTWDTTLAPPDCIPTPCMYNDSTSCAADTACNWFPCPAYPQEAECAKKLCTFGEKKLCEADMKCKWDTSAA
eukprot:gene8353-2655_t